MRLNKIIIFLPTFISLSLGLGVGFSLTSCKTKSISNSPTPPIPPTPPETICQDGSLDDIIVDSFTITGSDTSTRNITFNLTFTEKLYGSAVYCAISQQEPNALVMDPTSENLGGWLIVNPNDPTLSYSGNFECAPATNTPIILLNCATTCGQNFAPLYLSALINTGVKDTITGNPCTE